MTLDAKILAACALSRPAFTTVSSTIESADLSPQYLPLWQAIGDYYERDPSANAVDTDLITDRLAPDGGDKKVRAMRQLCGEVFSLSVSPANVAEYVREQSMETASMRLAAAIAGRRGASEVERLARAYTALLDTPQGVDDEANEVSWRDALRTRLDTSKRIKVSPPCLNKRLGGGIYPGTNITVFGRPELGKSALALTMGCGFARRGLRGLYLGNEDPVSSMMVRAASCLTNLTAEELQALGPEGVEELALSKGAGNMIFKDMSPGTPAEIERLIKFYRPEWIVIDQIRNIRIKDADGGTAALDQAAQFVRSMGKRYDLITIGVTQAGDNASGMAVLGLSHIDSSKTGIPGAADVIIGIGATDNLEAINQRMLTLSKNKVSGLKESWNISIDRHRSKYVTIK